MEELMATLKCPRCDGRVEAGDGWAQAALSTLIAAPAVPDMASVLHCPHCRHVFADSELRPLGAAHPWRYNAWVVAVLAAGLGMVLYRVFLG
jgi:uncharacterized C2H2 Zn-finger protein